MSNKLFVMLLVGTVVAVYAGIALRAYYRMRGTRVLVCPETKKPVAVTVDAAYAAATAIWDKPELQVGACSQWPEHEGCRQACMPQVRKEPEATLAYELVKRWYEGKPCGICRRDMPELAHFGPKPGLLNLALPMSVPIIWDELPAQSLPAAFETHLPVCAGCVIAETFRRQFPDLAIDRKPHEHPGMSVH